MNAKLAVRVRGCLVAIAAGNFGLAETLARRSITPLLQDPSQPISSVRSAAFEVIRALSNAGSEEAIGRADSLEKVVRLCTPATATLAARNCLNFREAEAREYDRGFFGT